MKPDLQNIYFSHTLSIMFVKYYMNEPSFIINKAFKFLITPNFNLFGL